MFVNVSLTVDQLFVTVILMLNGPVANVKQMLVGVNLCDCVEVRHTRVRTSSSLTKGVRTDGGLLANGSYPIFLHPTLK